MPELPEVETVRRRLVPLAEGRAIARAEIRDARLVGTDDPRRVEERLAGRRIGVLDRRGKHLLFRLEGGDTLISHLRMTGNWLTAGEPAHARAVLELGDGSSLWYADARRFGTWHLLADDAAAAYLDARLGPEPLGDAFDGGVLADAFRGRRAPVKALLLDQRVVAGIGNIYADEALNAACIHPAVPAGRLRRAQLDALADAVRAALEEGIRAQGSSIRDFRSPDGGYGSMQESFRVYGRDGEPCPACGAEIVKTRCAGRGTHLCPSCQRRPRGMRTARRALERA